MDPRGLIDANPMSRLQWGIVAIMVGLNALDGFDVLAISFASPGIAAAWGIDRAALGVVLSMELVGMALGSVTLGGVADRLGRRRMILGCLPVMAIGMVGTSFAGGIVSLCTWRVLTGIGIGGMLAVTNAAVSEAANAARRSLCVVLMAAGYPVGAVLGGSVSVILLKDHGWPAIFRFGALVTLLFVPLVWWRAPESIAFEVQRQRPGALARINDLLSRMGHAPIERLPPPTAGVRKMPLAALFSRRLARSTVLMTIAYFAQLMTFYFILKWTPKIVVDLGFAPSSAAQVLVAANVGGALGAVLFGLVTPRASLRRLTMAVMGASVLTVAAFGHGAASIGGLAAIAAVAGFFTNAGVVGLYALLAERFDTGVRAAATGFAIGVGRGGSALAPALAGLLFAAGFGLQAVAAAMALGSAVALLSLVGLRAPREAVAGGSRTATSAT